MSLLSVNNQLLYPGFPVIMLIKIEQLHLRNILHFFQFALSAPKRPHGPSFMMGSASTTYVNMSVLIFFRLKLFYRTKGEVQKTKKWRSYFRVIWKIISMGHQLKYLPAASTSKQTQQTQPAQANTTMIGWFNETDGAISPNQWKHHRRPFCIGRIVKGVGARIPIVWCLVCSGIFSLGHSAQMDFFQWSPTEVCF